MKSLSTKSIALGFALATTLLSGCGSTGLSTVAASALSATDAKLSASAGANKGGPRGGQEKGRGGDVTAMFAELDLTADQKTALAAIATKYAPAKPTEPAAKPSEDATEAALRAALTADTIDDTALRAAIAAQEAKAPAGPKDDNRVAMLTEVRALLTDTQIAAVVAKLQAGPAARPLGAPDGVRPSGAPDHVRPSGAPSGAPDHVRPSGAPSGAPDGGKAKVTLTTDQQAKLDAFQAAMKPAAPDASASPKADPRAGELAFWQTGDTSGLAAPAGMTRPAFPVDAFVAFAESLDATQRKAMFANGPVMMAFGGGMGGPGGHEGPGGKGGHEGPGGQGGFGGGRGPKPEASPSTAA